MKPCTLLSHFFKSFANLDPFRKLFCPDQDQDLTFEFNTMQSCILCIRVTHQISFRFESSFKSYCDHGQTDRPTEIKKCIFQVSERKKRELKEELYFFSFFLFFFFSFSSFFFFFFFLAADQPYQLVGNPWELPNKRSRQVFFYLHWFFSLLSGPDVAVKRAKGSEKNMYKKRTWYIMER